MIKVEKFNIYKKPINRLPFFFHLSVQFEIFKRKKLIISDMTQFGLSSANSHWGYSSAGYSPYLTGSSLTSCSTPSAAQFNNPALGFTCSTADQNAAQDFSGSSRDCVPSNTNFYIEI